MYYSRQRGQFWGRVILIVLVISAIALISQALQSIH